jgi:hypothetical protein
MLNGRSKILKLKAEVTTIVGWPVAMSDNLNKVIQKHKNTIL